MNTFLITSHLQSSFRRIGARVRAQPLPTPRAGWRAAAAAPRRIDVHDDAFELTLPVTSSAVVLDCRPAERHLVLSLQDHGATPERFLCGFDERHWFAAAVAAANVPAAKDSLMPAEVRAAAHRAGLRHAHFYHRHTRAFVRQGEWFFVPDASANPDRLLINQREPLIRPGGGKPHVVDELVRGHGQMLWRHATLAPRGLTETEFEKQTEWARRASGWSRRTLVRNGSVLARGAVRHPDHATIRLGTWHRVFINSEVRPDSLGFLD